MITVEVIAGGLLTTVQDAIGRPGYERFGVPAGGALDPFAARSANLLAGNPPNCALLEITIAGPTLRFDHRATIALAGADLGATVNGLPLDPGWSLRVPPGARLAFSERRSGARAYLALAGGLTIRPVLGSPSTDLGSGFGGLMGRPIQDGDILSAPDQADGALLAGRRLVEPPFDLSAPIRVVPGPHLDRFPDGAFAQLCETVWRITIGNRMGYRLGGPPIPGGQADVPSLGLPVGAIQVPADGQPIVLLVDHQPTGGYRVLATVIRADLDRIAQRLPGDPVRFTPTTLAAARAAYQARLSVPRLDDDWLPVRLAGG